MREPMSDERLAEVEAKADMPCFVQSCSCVGDQFRSLVAEIRRLKRDLDWVRAATTTNASVCESCADEIKRAVGWQ